MESGLTAKHKFAGAFVAISTGVIFAMIACKKLIKLAYASGYESAVNAIDAPYNYTLLVPNYFSNGFMRRGLAGTVMSLIDDRPLTAAGVHFHVFSAIWLAVAIALVLGKVTRANLAYGGWLGLVLILSPQFRLYDFDIARTDMFAAGFVAFSLFAALQQRWQIAAIILAVGSLSHEAVVIMGGPMLVAAWYVAYRDERTSRAQIIGALGSLAALLIATALLQSAFPADPEQIAATMRANTEPSPARDIAIYMTAAEGARTLKTSACLAQLNLAYPLFKISAFIFIPFYYVLLGYRPIKIHGLMFGAVVLVPLLFLTIVAIDYGRWFTMAAFNAWLCAALLAARSDSMVPAPRLNLLIAVPAIALLMAAGQTDIFYANTATVRAARTIWEKPIVRPTDGIAICDPQWRDVTDGKGPASAAQQPGKQPSQ
jgi:hypothetical protein